MFKPGQKIVCIKAFIKDADGNEPSVGDVVTMNGVFDAKPKTHIFLLEWPLAKCGRKQAFTARGFVPLEDWKQAEYMVEELLQEETIEA